MSGRTINNQDVRRIMARRLQRWTWGRIGTTLAWQKDLEVAYTQEDVKKVCSHFICEALKLT
jgi:hypothetical protein